MAGTQATYQGLPVRNVRFRRSRGWKADTTTVELFAADFQGFQLATAAPGQLAVDRTTVRIDLARLKRPGVPLPPPFPRRLEFVGALVLAEVDKAGKEFVVVVDPLYCLSVETVRTSSDGSVCVLQARLVDARYFAAQGFVRRWSWNRSTADGRYASDSVKPGDEPYSLAEVAREVASHLFGTPDLKHVPARWHEVKPAVEVPRFAPATAALATLCQGHGTLEPCLALDGSLALYEPGEGQVGFAPGGKGHANTAELPHPLHVDLDGTGQIRGAEATYPPDYVVVVGGLRVASVRLDGLEPVLVIERDAGGVEGVFVIDEALLRKLTKSRFGLDWLHAFLLVPQSYQNAVGLDPRVLTLLREQAYRLWRIPGVVGADGERGPNAHLLPLLERAETVAGRRLPVKVEAYRFASVHRAMADSREAQQAGGAHQRLRELREAIRKAFQKAGEPDPWSGQDVGFHSRYVSDDLLYQLVGKAGGGVAYGQFVEAVNHARVVLRIEEVSQKAAREYEREVVLRYANDASLPNVGKELYDLAKEVASFEGEVAKARSIFEDPDSEALQQIKEKGQVLRDRVQDQINALVRRMQEEQTRQRVGASTAKPPQTAVFLRNLPREVDTDARVYSAELGIVRTSDLCGHVAEEGVPTAESTTFVPKSPLVTFGAVLRPRVDVSSGRPITGGSTTSGESKVPTVLSDTESYYTAAFRRVAPGSVERIEVNDVPQGQGVVVERPDLVELVPLEGESNRATLDETAVAQARSLVAKPERIEARKVTLARPWPVNCDGVVAGVEIVMRPGGKGFLTTIHVGSEAPALDPRGGTRVRPRRAAPSDAAAREGLLP